MRPKTSSIPKIVIEYDDDDDSPVPMVARERMSIRKRKVMKYGRNIVKVRVGRTREMFTVHEELLCCHSAYFREKLQKHRKPIEGVCPICHETLDLTRSEITFCRSTCGVNMHHDCMKTWREEKSAREEAITCPMCRQAWPEDNHEQTLLCTDLDAKAFDRYNDWLYHRELLLDEEPTDLQNSEDINEMIKAYQLSRKVKDNKFSKATLQTLCELFQDSESYPNEASVRLAYSTTTKTSRLRKLIVDTYVSQAQSSWFDDLDNIEDGDDYPLEFMKDLTMAFLKQKTKSEDCYEAMEALMDKHCVSESEDD